MFRVSARSADDGVVVFIDSPEGVVYRLRVVLLGAGGRELVAQLEGTTATGGTWRQHDAPFAVMRVGISDLELLPGPARPGDTEGTLSHPHVNGIRAHTRILTKPRIHTWRHTCALWTKRAS